MQQFESSCLNHAAVILAIIAAATCADAAGGPGNALHLDGVDDYVTVPAGNSLNAYPITVTAWVRTSQTSGAVDLVRKSPDGPPGWYLSLSNGVVTAGYTRMMGSEAKVASTNSVANGNWRHLAFTVNDSGMAVYVDGAMQTSSPWTGQPGSFNDNAETRLGGPALLNGDLDEVTVWNVPLSNAELISYKNRSLAGTETGLLAYFRCDETNGTILADSAPFGGNNNGTIVNGAAFVPSDILPFSPTATTLAATPIIRHSATLNGVCQPNGAATSGWFEWGATTNYGFSTAAQHLGAGLTLTNFGQRLLLNSNTYHFRAVASNNFGLAMGSDATFTISNVTAVASAATGGGQPFDLLQPSLELNFIICTNGTFPQSGESAVPPFLGEVRLFAGNFAPAGWTFCHGQLVSTNQFALYYTVRETFGGNGGTNFALPDLRSRSIAGIGQGPGLGQIYFGYPVGATQQTLVTAAMPAHAHSLPLPFGGNSGSAGLNFPLSIRQPVLGMQCLIFTLGNFPSAGQTTFEPFMGQMPMFAGYFSPQNAPRAEGQLLSSSQNSSLFSLLRTNFGGDNTFFALPDLRGRSPMNIGQGPGLTTRALGQETGRETATLTIAQMPAHQHAMPSVPPLASVTGSAGSNQPQSLLHPSLAVRFLICTNGEVPTVSFQATNKMLGEIVLYAGTNVPGGWTMCDGQLLNVASFPSLFSVISNLYGGDGATTFALPNLAGRIPVGAPNGQPGAVYGVEQFTVTEAQLPAHTHGVPPLDYQGWSEALGLPDAMAAFDADADGDGARNGFEWVTGTNPTNTASLAPLTIAAEGEQAKLSFSRNTHATDITIQLQRTSSLADTNAWTGLVTNVAGVWTSGIVSETGTNIVKTVEVSDALTNNAAANYRLKITRP
jgi:microcystin-dependent protein